MADKGYASFDGTVEKTNRILKEIEEAMGWPEERRDQYVRRAEVRPPRATRSPDRRGERPARGPAADAGPGLYFEGWDPTDVPSTREEFVQRVQRQFPFAVDGGVERVVHVVLQVVRRHITEGEWQDIESSMPKDLVPLMQ